MDALIKVNSDMIKCPLCCHYITVSQRVPFPVEKMGCCIKGILTCMKMLEQGFLMDALPVEKM